MTVEFEFKFCSLLIHRFSAGINYFGLSFNISILSGNPYLNYFLMSVVELPAYAASWLAARSFPRRLSFISLALLGAIALLLIQITLHGKTNCFVSLCLNIKIHLIEKNIKTVSQFQQ